MESSKGKVDQNVTVKANEFERDGYDFAGWNTVADPETESGTAYAAGDDYKLTPGEDKVYAIWKAKDDELVYDANGGTGTMESSKGKVDQNVTVKANEFERDGYEFVGWNTVADPETETGTEYKAGDDYKLTPGEDKVYAIWKAKDDKLFYDANGGFGEMDPTEGKVDQRVIVSDNEFYNPGYLFVTWNTVAEPTDENPGEEYAEGTDYKLTPGEDKLYAIWEKNPEDTYRIDYYVRRSEDGNYDNGLISDTKNPSDYVHETDEEVWVRTTEGIIGSTAKPDGGYKFIGWYMYNDLPNTEDRGDGDGGYSGKLVTTDLVLSPEKIASELEALFPDGIYQWTAFEARFAPSDDTYNAYYVAEAGGKTTNPMDTDNVRSTEKITGSTAQPETGYEFDGWYVVKKVNGVETDVLIEGAKEQLKPEEVIANLNKSENIDSATNVVCEQPTYYTYEDTTFKAKFKAVIYNITYEYRLAEGVEKPANWDALVTELATHNRTAMSGEEFMCPDLPTVDGYTFGLWNMEKVAKETPSTLGKILNFFGDVADFITGKTDVRAESQKMIMPASDIVVYSIVTKNPEQLDPQPDPKPDPKPTPDDDDDDDDDDTPRRRRNTPGNNDNNNNDNNDNTGDPQVLGDKRNPADDKAVLGAKRDQEEEKKVLGARRGGTDDNTNTSRIIVLLIAAGAVATLLVTGKKRKEEEEQQ
ncbi:repeat domain (List_Bact_rpt) [Butyrivibrio sp. INlla16]|nr:repeat domain (List_Bact_rpt) [Butyrivibrio sp. INlla16]